MAYLKRPCTFFSHCVISLLNFLILHFHCRKVWLTPVKTVSLRQQSGPRYRRPTTSPQVPQMSQIHPDQMTNLMRSPSLTARVQSLSMALTAKRQHATKRKALAANTHRCRWPARPSSVCRPIVCPPPTESLHTKKTITVTRKRRAKRTIWSIQLLLHVPLGLRQILQTTAPRHLKALDHRRSSAANQPTPTVLMTTVHCRQNLKNVFGTSTTSTTLFQLKLTHLSASSFVHQSWDMFTIFTEAIPKKSY